MATTIHAGDCSTDCETCRLQCECQDCRIQSNIQSDLDYALETGDWDLLESIFEDRDPLEFI
jgi:hypothetical protein